MTEPNPVSSTNDDQTVTNNTEQQESITEVKNGKQILLNVYIDCYCCLY